MSIVFSRLNAIICGSGRNRQSLYNPLSFHRKGVGRFNHIAVQAVQGRNRQTNYHMYDTGYSIIRFRSSYSKLCNLYFTYELARRLQNSGKWKLCL